MTAEDWLTLFVVVGIIGFIACAVWFVRSTGSLPDVSDLMDDD